MISQDEQVDLLVARVVKHLPKLDVQLRAPATRRVCARALEISDGEVEEEGALILSLCRAALAAMARWVKRSKEPAAGAHSEVNVEQGLMLQADLVDEAQVALKAVCSLVTGLVGTGRSEARLDSDTLLSLSARSSNPEFVESVRELALNVTTATLERLPHNERQLALGLPALRALRKYASGDAANGFTQAAALRAVWAAEANGCLEVLEHVLRNQFGSRGMVARHAAAQLLAFHVSPDQAGLALLDVCGEDPSQHVRQGLVRALSARVARTRLSPTAHQEAALFLGQLQRLFRADPSARVGGVILLELEQLARDEADAAELLEVLLLEAATGTEPLLHRAALFVAQQVYEREEHGLTPEQIAPVLSTMLRALATQVTSEQLARAEAAASLLLRLSVRSQPGQRKIASQLAQVLSRLAEGQAEPIDLPSDVSPAELQRILYAIGCEDLPLSFTTSRTNRLHLRRGERRRFAPWRALHELFHPAPDKRPGFLHTRGLANDGDTLVVPLRMAEVAPTRVPGERQTVFRESWAGFLPRVEDALGCCNSRSGLRRLLTSFGTVEVVAPTNWFRRLWARWVLTFRFASFALSRLNSLQAAGTQKTAYANRLRRLGFELRIHEEVVALGKHEARLTPTYIQAFFSVAPYPVVLWLEDALQYLLAPSGNTALQLALVVWFVLMYMLTKAAWTQQRFEASRQRIPLSIGGWGSRGKSGTERLKAALFHSNHFDVVSKTTGCEAMMIVARRGQAAQELFLYRAYDKATIWEQARVVEYAEHLGAQVFLWECMALQPEFVNILNRQWMKDPITTITNAYPDHEDVMGPSGEDVARVVGSFIPWQGTVFSSEYQMLPVIREAARESQATLVEVQSLEADLLPEDLLARFPYQEHPLNIALVLRMAEHLGIDRERALIDIADHVVPDLGVLKTFAEFEHRTRQVRFSNGMSANERAGFLSNWGRLGFESHDPDASADVWQVAVINNRADRVPRSRVFAELFANDASVDAMVVIGTNQLGMRRFLIEEAENAGALSRFLPDTAAAAVDSVDRLCRHLNVPLHSATVAHRLRQLTLAVTGAAEVEGLASLLQFLTRVEQGEIEAPNLTEAATAFIAGLLKAAASPAALALPWTKEETPAAQQAALILHLDAIASPWLERQQLLRAARSDQVTVASFSALLRKTYAAIVTSRIHVLERSDATGDQVIDYLVSQSPPGLRLHVLGCQNIKGTGLDFVYRCISIDRVTTWVQQIQTDALKRDELLSQLGAYNDFGVVDAAIALKFAAAALQNEDFASEHGRLRLLEQTLEERYPPLVASLGGTSKPAWWSRALGAIEPMFDHMDSVRRRHRANRLMKQLIAGKIGLSTAVLELRAVVARQKGGWLAKDVQSVLRLKR